MPATNHLLLNADLDNLTSDEEVEHDPKEDAHHVQKRQQLNAELSANSRNPTPPPFVQYQYDECGCPEIRYDGPKSHEPNNPSHPGPIAYSTRRPWNLYQQRLLSPRSEVAYEAMVEAEGDPVTLEMQNRAIKELNKLRKEVNEAEKQVEELREKMQRQEEEMQKLESELHMLREELKKERQEVPKLRMTEVKLRE
jgi:DNA gyrase/topoisomerase IV subunit A